MEENKSSMQNNEKAVGKTYDFFTKSRTKKDFSPFRANIISI